MQGVASEKRMYFLDNLRSFIVLLVVVFHASMAYMPSAPWWWYVLDSQRNPFFDLFVLINDVFMMPTMFFIAGYFAVKSLVRTGTTQFVRDKMFRLVIPWIVGVIFLAPAVTYFIYITRTATPPPYFYYWFHLFFGEAYQQAHYWFLGALALFCLVLALVYQQNWLKLSVLTATNPSTAFLSGFVVLGSTAFFGINMMVNDYAWVNVKYILMIQPTRFVLYILYFALGVYASRHQWFTSGGYCPSPRWWVPSAVVAGGLFIGCKIIFAKNATIVVMAANAVVHTLFCLCAVFALCSMFQRWGNSHAYLWRRLAANSYAIYFVHQFPVFSLNYALLNLDAGPVGKFFLASSLAVVISYVSCELVIGKLPLFAGRKQTG